MIEFGGPGRRSDWQSDLPKDAEIPAEAAYGSR